MKLDSSMRILWSNNKYSVVEVQNKWNSLAIVLNNSDHLWFINTIKEQEVISALIKEVSGG